MFDDLQAHIRRIPAAEGHPPAAPTFDHKRQRLQKQGETEHFPPPPPLFTSGWVLMRPLMPIYTFVEERSSDVILSARLPLQRSGDGFSSTLRLWRQN